MAVQETMREADKDNKGNINFKDFSAVLYNIYLHIMLPVGGWSRPTFVLVGLRLAAIW